MLDGAQLGPVLDISSKGVGAVVVICGLTLSNGRAVQSEDASADGGGVYAKRSVREDW